MFPGCNTETEIVALCHATTLCKSRAFPNHVSVYVEIYAELHMKKFIRILNLWGKKKKKQKHFSKLLCLLPLLFMIGHSQLDFQKSSKAL